MLRNLTGQENMPTRKVDEKNVRKLTRMGRAGSSLGMTIPKELVQELGWFTLLNSEAIFNQGGSVKK